MIRNEQLESALLKMIDYSLEERLDDLTLYPFISENCHVK